MFYVWAVGVLVGLCFSSLWFRLGVCMGGVCVDFRVLYNCVVGVRHTCG